MDAARPPELAARLLLAERDALLPILRRTPADAFDRPTVCTGWSVRDVLAHCGSALTRAAEGTLHDFSPEANEADVAERRPWPLEAVVAELERGYGAAAPVITAAGGRLDGIALGEWVHGGDVREPLGVPRAYQSEGVEDALVLLVERSRRHTVPPTRVRLPDRELWLGPAEPAGAPAQAAGTPAEAGAAAELVTDVPTLIRLCSGRRPDPSRFRLAGATPDRYLLFR